MLTAMRYEKHNEEVLQYFADTNHYIHDRLLILDLNSFTKNNHSKLWQILFDFLGCDLNGTYTQKTTLKRIIEN